MSSAPKQPQSSVFTGSQKLGLYVFAIANVFCAYEMTPGWSSFHLGLSREVLYAIAAGAGLVGGALIGRRFVLPGMIGGAVAGAGALFSLGKYLDSVTKSYSTLVFLWALGGALPGIIIGLVLGWIQKSVTRGQSAGPQ